jgi:hypothetical protein
MARSSIATATRLVDELEAAIGLYGVDSAAWLDKATASFSKVVGKAGYISVHRDNSWAFIWRQNAGVGVCVENVVYFTTEELTDSPNTIRERIRECIAQFA